MSLLLCRNHTNVYKYKIQIFRCHTSVPITEELVSFDIYLQYKSKSKLSKQFLSVISTDNHTA